VPFPNCIGNKRFWTRERVLEGLRLAATQIEEPLPCSDRLYARLKNGHLDWPNATRIYFYFNSIGRAWLAAGVPRTRVTLFNVPWLPEETGYLLDMAGILTLKAIAKHLCRSPGACKRQLHKYGITARANQGYLSAAEVSKLYGCSYHRVCQLLAAGTIKGRYDRRRNRWQIDPINITPAAEVLLMEPKKTHKSTPPDLGDYYQRHGLRRTMVDGRLVTVPC
jgi:hypothetical protein